MTDDIASLRASVERLTAQAADERKRHRLQLMAIEVCAGCNTLESARKQRIHPSSPYWTSAYAYTFEAVAREMRERARADDAEATIARLAMVVRAASKWRNAAPCSTAFHREGHSCEECEALGEEGAALSSLTPEDRRRAGIEG